MNKEGVEPKGDCITRAGVIDKYLLEGKDAFKKSIESIDKLLNNFQSDEERFLFPR